MRPRPFWFSLTAVGPPLFRMLQLHHRCNLRADLARFPGGRSFAPAFHVFEFLYHAAVVTRSSSSLRLGKTSRHGIVFFRSRI